MKDSTSASAGSSSPRARARWLGLVLACALGSARADEVYRTPADFVGAAFGGKPPPAQTLRIDGELRTEAGRVLGHEPPRRAPYWQQESRSAWVLEEIGKERPITVGVVVDHARIEKVEVLIYRESRGWEVRLPGFVRQFQGAALKEGELDRRIDGISGATLSVRALQRLAQLALRLDRALHKVG